MPYFRMLLLLTSGILWTLTYILIIKRSFQDKTFGMPMIALCANISWEFIFAFIYPSRPPQLYVNIIWFSLDVIIIMQYLMFGASEFNLHLSKQLFYPTFLLTLMISFSAIIMITQEFNDWSGRYAAFSQNFLMSILFITMLLNRNSLKGQSLYIAFFKMLGTLAASLFFSTSPHPSPLISFLSIVILLFDVIYLVMIYQKCKAQSLNPWLRL